MIQAIIGLGNPGPHHHYNRHNIGFLVLDELAIRHGGAWHSQDTMKTATVTIHGNPILMVKPQTFMNNSGAVIPFLHKRGIEPSTCIIVHDELELPVGKITVKHGGSARGHNGLRSIIAHGGQDCMRVRCGIGRPKHREQVPDYVVQNFAPHDNAEQLITTAADFVEQLLHSHNS